MDSLPQYFEVLTFWANTPIFSPEVDVSSFINAMSEASQGIFGLAYITHLPMPVQPFLLQHAEMDEN